MLTTSSSVFSDDKQLQRHEQGNALLMLARSGSSRSVWPKAASRSWLHTAHGPTKPTRLSKLYMPTVRPEAISPEHTDSVALLIRGGYIRQSSSGLFTLLPLGLRVVKKIEAIIDEEMQSIDASRIEMPSLLSSTLWHKSGRFETIGRELFKVRDRRDSEFVLAPTCEEEVTKLIGEEVASWRLLPVRVYQVTTKYRDEPRPKSGLLRTKSFLMKDLYTFDNGIEQATQTYTDVTGAYIRVMERLFGVRGHDWLSVQADSGAMGGSLSHEYQVPDTLGEDAVVKCGNCSYASNIETAQAAVRVEDMAAESEDVSVTLYGEVDPSVGQCTLYAAMYKRGRKLNPLIARSKISDPGAQEIFPQPSNNSAWDWKDRPEGPLVRYEKLKVIVDEECKAMEAREMEVALLRAIETFGSPSQSADAAELNVRSDRPHLKDYFPQEGAIEILGVTQLRQIDDGDTCMVCRSGTLTETKSIEVGHTFLLGTRYSQSLGHTFTSKDSQQLFMQMGCFGIGISRVFGVLAQKGSRLYERMIAKNSKTNRNARGGLAWGPNAAPFRALLLLQRHDNEEQLSAAHVLSTSLVEGKYGDEVSEAFGGGKGCILASDIAIDDRPKQFSEKLNDADLLGSPVTFIIGKDFTNSGNVEMRYIADGQLAVKHVPLASFSA